MVKSKGSRFIIGLIVAVIGLLVSVWSFDKATAGEVHYYWVWVLAMLVTFFGMGFVFLQLLLWLLGPK